MKFASLPLVALVLICSSGAQAQAVTSAVAPRGVAEDVERGRQLYMANGCFSCHGTVGQGGERSAGPKIAPEPYPFEAFRVLVRTPSGAMPRMTPSTSATNSCATCTATSRPSPRARQRRTFRYCARCCRDSLGCRPRFHHHPIAEEHT